MQNAKDSFYEVLRGRLATLNPERTVVVRGVTRPGLIVDENEVQSTAALPDCFHLVWTSITVTKEGTLPLVSQTCEVHYSTAGSSWNGGLDRGRALSAMDGELSAAVQLCPRNIVKCNYAALANSGSVLPMSTRIWWSEVVFAPIKMNADRLSRRATVQVMSFQEAGEL